MCEAARSVILALLGGRKDHECSASKLTKIEIIKDRSHIRIPFRKVAKWGRQCACLWRDNICSVDSKDIGLFRPKYLEDRQVDSPLYLQYKVLMQRTDRGCAAPTFERLINRRNIASRGPSMNLPWIPHLHSVRQRLTYYIPRLMTRRLNIISWH